MSLYLAHAKAGKEFEVAEVLRAIANDAWVPRKAVFVRRGKKRRPELEVQPYLPNAIFVDLEDDQFHLIGTVKYLARTTHVIGPRDARDIERFRARVDAEMKEAERIQGNKEAIQLFKAGQAIEAINGPFKDTALRFLRMVERADMLHPQVEATAEMFGQTVRVALDPLDVRETG